MSRPGARSLDGENILPILSGEQAPRERQFCWRVRQPGEVYGQRAIRRGHWKYLWDRGTDFLFDLNTDPGERRNLAFRDPELVMELKKALAAGKDRCHQWSCASYELEVGSGQ